MPAPTKRPPGEQRHAWRFAAVPPRTNYPQRAGLAPVGRGRAVFGAGHCVRRGRVTDYGPLPTIRPLGADGPVRAARGLLSPIRAPRARRRAGGGLSSPATARAARIARV